MEKSTKRRVGIWLRVSTEQQAKSDSPEHHHIRAKMYAEAKGWDVVEVYHLEGVSGKSVLSNSEGKRMLRDIINGHINTLIFSKIARLARNMRELLEISDLFKKHNADLVSLEESIDTSSPAGRLFFSLQGALAEWEREEIGARVKASVRVRAKLGKSTGGQAPFGYKFVNKRLVINEEEAPIRKLMFDLYLEHKRIKAVLKKLNGMGHRTRKGKLWHSSVVRNCLMDTVAKGIRRVNFSEASASRGRWVLKPEHEWEYIQVPPIVSEEVFDKVNAIIMDNRSGRQPATNNREHLFTGLVKCSCGGRMGHVTTLKKYVCQDCRKKIPGTDLETIFKEQLKGLVFNEELLRKKLDSAKSRVDDIQEHVDSLQNEYGKVEAEIKDLLRLHREGQIPTQGFNKLYQPLYDRSLEIETAIPELEGKRDVLLIDAESTDQVIADAQDLYSRFDDFEHKSKRDIITAITRSIIVGIDEIEIELNYLTPPGKEELLGSTSLLFNSSFSLTFAP